MCGIVGYIGKEIKSEEVVKILKKLEYRGYDSAGICGTNGKKFKIIKTVGNISVLENALPANWKVSNVIAHTRWATNGVPNKVNAHPHSSKNGVWKIVHNGIIENADKIKKTLKSKPIGETDTEVLAYFLEENSAKNLKTFVRCFENVEGSFSVVAQNENLPDELFLAKQKSPLYVSENSGNFLIASDPICFAGFSKKYYTFCDGEFAHIKNNKILFCDKNLKTLSKDFSILTQSFYENVNHEYSYFMEKEIFEQKDVLLAQVEEYKSQQLLDVFDEKFLHNFEHIKFIGCGTAYHAAMMGAKYVQKLLNIPASAEIASEFIYNKPIFANEKDLFVFVSQSGETADTITALDIAKSHGSTCLAISNVSYSTLVQKAHFFLPIFAGVEVAVASTKAYVCQLSVLYMFVQNLANKIYGQKIDYYDEIKAIANNLFQFNFSQIEAIAEELKTKKDAVFIGKDLDHITAREAALKLKEIAYINANASPSGELKHGFLAIVEKNTPIVVFATNPEINNKTFNSMSEAVSRGANKILVKTSNRTNLFTKCINSCGGFFENKFLQKNLENEIEVFAPNVLLAPISAIVPLQYLAFLVSVKKKLNPDQPRNLAKSVTVE